MNRSTHLSLIVLSICLAGCTCSREVSRPNAEAQVQDEPAPIQEVAPDRVGPGVSGTVTNAVGGEPITNFMVFLGTLHGGPTPYWLPPKQIRNSSDGSLFNVSVSKNRNASRGKHSR